MKNGVDRAVCCLIVSIIATFFWVYKAIGCALSNSRVKEQIWTVTYDQLLAHIIWSFFIIGFTLLFSHCAQKKKVGWIGLAAIAWIFPFVYPLPFYSALPWIIPVAVLPFVLFPKVQANNVAD